MAIFNLTVNGKKTKVDVEPDMPLLWVVRDFVGLKGTKFGCGIAQCGACTVHVNGEATRSCQIPVSSLAKNAKITTIEGLTQADSLTAVQDAFITEGGVQCGFCTPGLIVAIEHLLDNNPDPSQLEVKEAISGNICRCTGYGRIFEAVNTAVTTRRATNL
jgi:isoquinoline 1-oxidoreductase alpha subunit